MRSKPSWPDSAADEAIPVYGPQGGVSAFPACRFLVGIDPQRGRNLDGDQASADVVFKLTHYRRRDCDQECPATTGSTFVTLILYLVCSGPKMNVTGKVGSSSTS